MTVSVLCLFLAVLCVGLQCVIVVSLTYWHTPSCAHIGSGWKRGRRHTKAGPTSNQNNNVDSLAHTVYETTTNKEIL